jgi:chemoreceptor-like protein with four helix bundle sensory module
VTNVREYRSEETDMKRGPGSQEIRWIVAGLVILALLVLAFIRFHSDPTQQLSFKATRVDLVGRMQVALAAASEAEKSAVLAVTDQDSQRFADQARAASVELDRERQELGKLLASGGTQRERELLARFTEAFENLRRVDEEVLRLAVKNTNLKAYGLLFGPAAEALAAMDGALTRLGEKRADPVEARRTMTLAFGARIAVLRIHALLAPHIAEESDPKMDRLEATMREEEKQVNEDLATLAAAPALRADPDLATARASFARYVELKAQILAFSRENTNVRSLSLSMGEERKAMLLCLDPLDALKQAILDEPIAGVSYGKLPTR